MLLAMHIPDGLLDPVTTVVTWGVAIGAITLALRRWSTQVGDRLTPLASATAATIFAAQMVNFPLSFVGLPASGHLLGGVLAAVLLGPWGGLLAITTVLIVQCLMFADGGLIALGANICNMAVLGSAGGYGIYQLLRRGLGSRGTIVAATLAAWLTVPLAALTFSIELSAGGLVSLGQVAPLMLGYHVPIGLGEAVLTGAALSWIARVRPELLASNSPTALEPARSSGWRWGTVGGLSIALAIAIFAAPWASTLLDGLETVLERLAIEPQAGFDSPAPLPDYEPFESPWGAIRHLAEHTPAALIAPLIGALGTLVTWGMAMGLARLGPRVAPPSAPRVASVQ